MSFIRVHWKHSIPSEPVLLYSELDKNRFEIRKLEIWADGHCGYADSNEEFGDTRLGAVTTPPLSEIAKQREFEPSEIVGQEFESVWARRKSSLRDMILLNDDKEAIE